MLAHLLDLQHTADLIKKIIGFLCLYAKIQIAILIVFQSQNTTNVLYIENAHDLQFIFDLLRQRSAQGLSLQLPLLAASLTEEEMSHLAQVVSQPQSLANSEQALRDYIAVIRKESLRQREHTDDELLLAMQKKNLEKKAYMEDKQ